MRFNALWIVCVMSFLIGTTAYAYEDAVRCLVEIDYNGSYRANEVHDSMDEAIQDAKSSACKRYCVKEGSIKNCRKVCEKDAKQLAVRCTSLQKVLHTEGTFTKKEKPAPKKTEKRVKVDEKKR